MRPGKGSGRSGKYGSNAGCSGWEQGPEVAVWGAGLEQEPDKNANFITRNEPWILISRQNGRTRDSPTKKR